MASFESYVDPLEFLDTMDQLSLSRIADTAQSTSSESGASPNAAYNWLWPADAAAQGADLVFIDDERGYGTNNAAAWLELQEAEWNESYDGSGVINPDGNAGKLSKRKTQNRAAQRAFRERKERSLRELKESVTSLTVKTANLESENHRLTGLLHEARAEVETLRSLTSLPEAFKACPTGDRPNCSKAMLDGQGAIVLRIDLDELKRQQQNSSESRSPMEAS